MTLTEALKVTKLVDDYTGAPGQDFPTDEAILRALQVLRDTLLRACVIHHDDHGNLQATPLARQEDAPVRELPIDHIALAERQRKLPSDLQMAITAQLKECGKVFKPFLRTPKDAHTAFDGLLEAFVSIAEIGATGRRNPKIVVAKDCH